MHGEPTDVSPNSDQIRSATTSYGTNDGATRSTPSDRFGNLPAADRFGRRRPNRCRLGPHLHRRITKGCITPLP